MGLLVDGVWQDDDQGVRTQNGHFVRPVTRYRSWITPAASPAQAAMSALRPRAGVTTSTSLWRARGRIAP